MKITQITGRLAAAALSCVGLLTFAVSANAQPSLSWDYDFVKLDYPGAAVSYPLGMNARREIVGVHIGADGIVHGYIYSNGKFTSLDYPGAAQVPGGGTSIGGINDRGDIAGVYVDQQGFQHGFIRSYALGCDDTNSQCQPTYHAIDVPGAVQNNTISFELGPGLGTDAFGINNLQTVVGLYATKGLYGAAFEYNNGLFKTDIDDPASSHLPGNGSRMFSINDLGFGAGAYQTQASPSALSISHGFVYTGKDYIPVFVPGSDQGGFGTQANGINIFLQVVGVYTDPQGTFHGMLWAGGQAFSIDFPGVPYTEVHSINAGGDLTGAYILDPETENYRGFVAYRKTH